MFGLARASRSHSLPDPCSTCSKYLQCQWHIDPCFTPAIATLQDECPTMGGYWWRSGRDIPSHVGPVGLNKEKLILLLYYRPFFPCGRSTPPLPLAIQCISMDEVISIMETLQLGLEPLSPEPSCQNCSEYFPPQQLYKTSSEKIKMVFMQSSSAPLLVFTILGQAHLFCMYFDYFRLRDVIQGQRNKLRKHVLMAKVGMV